MELRFTFPASRIKALLRLLDRGFKEVAKIVRKEETGDYGVLLKGKDIGVTFNSRTGYFSYNGTWDDFKDFMACTGNNDVFYVDKTTIEEDRSWETFIEDQAPLEIVIGVLDESFRQNYPDRHVNVDTMRIRRRFKENNHLEAVIDRYDEMYLSLVSNMRKNMLDLYDMIKNSPGNNEQRLKFFEQMNTSFLHPIRSTQMNFYHKKIQEFVTKDSIF